MKDMNLPSVQNQVNLLLSWGMSSRRQSSREELERDISERLSYINFRRLSSYWPSDAPQYTDANIEEYRFRPGTYWEDVMARYMFDRRLRYVLFDALSRFEIALRTQIAHCWTSETKSSHPHAKSNNYRAHFNYTDLLRRVQGYYDGNLSEETRHYRVALGLDRVDKLPVSAFLEYTTFGNLQKLIAHGFKESSPIPALIAENMGMPNDISFFTSVVAVLADVRNTCAHQSRVYSRRWLTRDGSEILKESQNPQWRLRWNESEQAWKNQLDGSELVKAMDSTAAVLTCCHIIIKSIAPHSHWKERLIELLDKAEIPSRAYKALGFTTKNWRFHPLWQ